MLDRLGNEIDFTELFMEETLSSKDKKELSDSMYGLVYTDEKGNKIRKFPLNDETHVRQAAIFFDRAKDLSDDQKRELARNIVRRAKELDMDYSGWESLKPYLDKAVKESYVQEGAGMIIAAVAATGIIGTLLIALSNKILNKGITNAKANNAKNLINIKYSNENIKRIIPERGYLYNISSYEFSNNKEWNEFNKALDNEIDVLINALTEISQFPDNSVISKVKTLLKTDTGVDKQYNYQSGRLFVRHPIENNSKRSIDEILNNSEKTINFLKDTQKKNVDIITKMQSETNEKLLKLKGSKEQVESILKSQPNKKIEKKCMNDIRKRCENVFKMVAQKTRILDTALKSLTNPDYFFEFYDKDGNLIDTSSTHSVVEQYMTFSPDPDSTSGTSEFDDSDHEPDDCYTESFEEMFGYILQETYQPYDEYLKLHQYDPKTNTIVINGKRMNAGIMGSNKQRNRMNKFLRENNYNPKDGTIETSIDENGTKRRVEFNIDPHDGGSMNRYVIVDKQTGETKRKDFDINMSPKSISNKPGISNQTKEHETGHGDIYLHPEKYEKQLQDSDKHNQTKKAAGNYRGGNPDQVRHAMDPEENVADLYATKNNKYGQSWKDSDYGKMIEDERRSRVKDEYQDIKKNKELNQKRYQQYVDKEREDGGLSKDDEDTKNFYGRMANAKPNHKAIINNAANGASMRSYKNEMNSRKEFVDNNLNNDQQNTQNQSQDTSSPPPIKESFEEMFGPVIQEVFDAVTGEEIPIEKAYTMEEMAKRTLSLDEAKAIEKDELIPIKPPKADEVYFGSPTNHMPEIDLDRPLFVSPYKGIASIFIWGDMGLQDRIPRGTYNHNYEEWINFDEKKMKNPLKEVHVYVEGAPFLEPFTVEQEGYIHCISTKDYLNNFFRKPWMTKDLEYLIAKTDNMKVEFTRSIKCNVKYYIKGRPSPKGKSYGPSKSGVLQYIHKIAKSIHAKYKADQKEPTGNQNCLLCAWCAEASIRGGEYLPRPVYSPRDSALEITPGDIVGGVTKKNPGNFYDLLEHLRGDSIKQPFARWYCHVKWGHSNGGHEFIIVKIDEDAFNIMDPQQGVVRPLTADDSYMKNVDWEGTYICRIDDKPFKYMKLDQINDPKKTLPWDPKKDIPYMVKHGLCTKEEAEKELKKTETNLFTSELKKALHQTPIQETALPEGVYLRCATESDLTNIIQWKLDSVNPETRNDQRTIAFIKNDAKENLKDTKMIMYNNDLIGVLESCYIDNGEWWYIGEIYLIPEYRGRGFGRAILQREIDYHDKIKLRVSKNNTHAIDLYKSLGFNIAEEDEYAYIMTLVKDNIQEGAWNDIRNGVNPWSKKRVFHITKQGHLDGHIFKPRVPEYLDKYDPSQDKFEDVDNPRICFSNSIEGALNAILVNIGRWKTVNKLGDWYVYVPEKPLKEYKYRTTRQLVDEKKVYDANVTNEIWIEEPVRLKQYGIIHVDQVSDKHTKKTVPTTTGFVGHRYRYDFKYHWLVKPKVIADLPYDYSPKSVCEDMVNELSGFKYGLGYKGSIHHGSSKDFDEKYRLESPEEFEKNGGGICYDFVEWEAGYLEAYGYTCRKFFISTDTEDMDTHTFILVDDGNGKFIYTEAAFKLLEGVHKVGHVDEAIRMIVEKIWDINNNAKKYDKINYYVWEYSGHPPYGSDMKTCHKYFSKGEPFHEGSLNKPKKIK